MSADIYDQIIHWCVSPSHLGWEYCIMYMSNNCVYWQLQRGYFAPALFNICHEIFHLDKCHLSYVRRCCNLCNPCVRSANQDTCNQLIQEWWHCMSFEIWLTTAELFYYSSAGKGNAVFCSELRAWAHILKGKKKPLRINNLSHFIRQFSSHLKLLWWQGGILRQLMTYAKPTHCKLHSS